MYHYWVLFAIFIQNIKVLETVLALIFLAYFDWLRENSGS